MTEDEAITKACHKTWDEREQKFTGMCIASDCMAWRWKEEPRPDDEFAPSEGKGYCGLAGKP